MQDLETSIKILRTFKPKIKDYTSLSPEEISEILHKTGHETGNSLTAAISLASIIEKYASQINSESKLSSYASSIISECWKIHAHNEREILLLSQKPTNPASYDLKNIFTSAIQKMSSRTSQQIRLNMLPPTEDSNNLIITTDSEQCIILIQEIINNALAYCKYNSLPEEEIIISFTHPTNYSNDFTYLTITNYLTKAIDCELDKLFNIFYTSFRDHKHLGLGFTLALKILERLKGFIEISEAELENKLVFNVTIGFPKAV